MKLHASGWSWQKRFVLFYDDLSEPTDIVDQQLRSAMRESALSKTHVGRHTFRKPQSDHPMDGTCGIRAVVPYCTTCHWTNECVSPTRLQEEHASKLTPRET